MSDWNEMKWRKEYRICTLAVLLTGSVLYGVVGAITAAQVPAAGQQAMIFIAAGLGGGYFCFSFLSGVLCTIRMVGRCSLKVKITLSILFFVPVWLVLAGMFYSIPYGVYNGYRLYKIKQDGDVDADS